MNGVETGPRQNGRKFGRWEPLCGGRRCWYEVAGRGGRKARHAEDADAEEETVRDEQGNLVEVHRKCPADLGRWRVR